MQKIYKVAIVGGGSAGLLSAIELLRGDNALCGKDVVILERNDRVGKKLIATGNGQGNLCNANFSADFYYGEKSFVRAFIEQANAIDIEKYLFSLGIPLVTANNGKKYPLSKQASAVLDVLRAHVFKSGCEERTLSLVKQLSFDGEKFVIDVDSQKVYAQNVILAVGGKSAKQFGTDGTAYCLAQGFGHKLTKLYPSLVQLKTGLTYIKGLKGLKENARIVAYDGNIRLDSSLGEILFTEYGVSGNATFSVSSVLSGAKNPFIKVEFLPELSVEEIIDVLKKREKTGVFNGDNYLSGIVNKRIGQAVLKRVSLVNPSTVANALKNFNLKVTGDLGFNYSQVTRGGIETKDVNAYTMESKLKKDLYMVGEMLDVDGACGGYNLTFAFITGIISARAIKSKLAKK